MKQKKVIKYIIIFLLPILLELTIFNINHYVSLFYKNYRDDLNLEALKEGFVINDINEEVKSMFIDVENEGFFDFKITLFDESHQNGYDAGTWYYSSSIKDSHFLKIHSYGKVNKIIINIIPRTTIKNFRLNTLTINNKIPLLFNFKRVIILYIFISLIILIKSKFFDCKFDSKKSKNITKILILLISSLFVLLIHNSNYYTVKYVDYISNHSIYQELTKSLAKGHFYLDIKPSDKLLSLENPYDNTILEEELDEGTDYILDFALFNGKYYCYFGIIPVLITYLPYYLITGKMLNNTTVLDIGLVLFTISCFLFVYQLFKKYFKDKSCLWYLSCSTLLTLSSGVMHIVRKGYFYGIPNTYAVAFSLLGLTFWLKSIKEDKISSKNLALGSTFMALVAGCRPQMLLFSALVIPLFYKQIKEKKFKLKHFISLFAPYIVIGAFIMYYNYARFGSVFDFGSSYNLTSNDMNKRGFNLERLIYGFSAYLFEIPKVNTVFPFIHEYSIDVPYIGQTVSETMCGGLIFLNLFSFFGLFYFLFKKDINNKTLSDICLINLIASVIIIAFDCEAAGIIPRYLFDFGSFIVISAIIVLSSFKELFNNKRLQTAFGIILGITIMTSLLLFFTDDFVGHNFLNAFYNWYYTLMFWI